MILVRGPWDETPGSPDLPFDVNHSMFFSKCVQVTRPACWCIFRMPILCTRVLLLWVVSAWKEPEGQTEVVRDFRVGAASRCPSYRKELA